MYSNSYSNENDSKGSSTNYNLNSLSAPDNFDGTTRSYLNYVKDKTSISDPVKGAVDSDVIFKGKGKGIGGKQQMPSYDI